MQHSLEPLAQLVELPDPKEFKQILKTQCVLIPGPQAVSKDLSTMAPPLEMTDLVALWNRGAYLESH